MGELRSPGSETLEDNILTRIQEEGPACHLGFGLVCPPQGPRARRSESAQDVSMLSQQKNGLMALPSSGSLLALYQQQVLRPDLWLFPLPDCFLQSPSPSASELLVDTFSLARLNRWQFWSPSRQRVSIRFRRRRQSARRATTLKQTQSSHFGLYHTERFDFGECFGGFDACS